jgi:hypothetical protein
MSMPIANCPSPTDDSWQRLRGMLKDIFVELGGGEAYLRAERSAFCKLELHEPKDDK